MNTKRIGIKILGVVQGVGFRPYVYRHACALNLTGYIQNTSAGVSIEIEGLEDQLERFLRQLQTSVPPHAYIQSLQYSYLDALGYESFEIRSSPQEGETTALILPDIATCPYCLDELLDPTNRRYQYPFINCTHCGPRYTIMHALPYDRGLTSMRKFSMCPDCTAEYNSPVDRRFHAQPNACPRCGPQLELWDSQGQAICGPAEAMTETAERIKEGRIVAVKGLGGFHLIADAARDSVVKRLRMQKGRDEKALAIMCPDIEWAERLCYVTQKERHMLRSPEAPIVLLQKKNAGILSPNVAPNNPYLGIMLPYTPLHHVLLRALKQPVIATSANFSDEPICIDEFEAVERLGEVADYFLVHDRPIVRHADDAIVRLVQGRPMVIRRARGYAPLPVNVGTPLPDTIGYGGQLKSTVAVSRSRNVFLSQHIGDLENPQTWLTYKTVMEDMQEMFGVTQPTVACDAHPDYLSTKLAYARDPQPLEIQHHHAHVVACMAENHLSGKVLGICWDGSGYGDDQTVWGGEFLICDAKSYQRPYHFRTFPLPGGEQAVKEPRRTALGMLWAMHPEGLKTFEDLPSLEAFKRPALKNLTRILEGKVSSPMTSSVGRIYDAVASLLGLVQESRYEGQAAQQVEFAGAEYPHIEHYPYRIGHGLVDWHPMLKALIADIRKGTPSGMIATKFQNTLVEMAVGVCHRSGDYRIVLSGGCFQNKYLSERLITRLQEQHYQVYWHQLIPPNDAGIALGQCIVAAARQAVKPSSKILSTSGSVKCV